MYLTAPLHQEEGKENILPDGPGEPGLPLAREEEFKRISGEAPFGLLSPSPGLSRR